MNENDLFCGDLREKFFDILFHATRNSVEDEIQNLLKKYIAMEHLLEQNGIDLKQVDLFEYENAKILDEKLQNMYMHLSSEILTKSI
ncbi:DUF2018 family protein [Campylobacter sp. RM12327]|uniref:Domain of uncharacterized function (DUF2018) n=1 Tax=Campylobacter sputorum subsp. sputorum TaxID=32024 RepID=A0A381DGZ3_9BACT|nr:MULTISPECIES: DUF2018 family protein [Campylobacter]ASM34994.1 DUF2018 domain protein [Campylobacter sputorum aubsp. sputorum RM3237]ASM36653.1 DUF2018 domain protein [Campylobacter sputorum bv. faecalis CCUG 20703]ASM39972.1 DUF2018 domain protein [Campylobacter sputorum]KAB0581876.1 DUF2018 family protein [Campylobacter sputorum subsp. sputorum]MBE7357623.1 DUF2018 family protein [Campylobacter sp. RM11302]